MPVLNVKMDNILIFDNFEINFTYPQKINSFLVKDEHLRNWPSFRYKKVNIFIGSNASGKTLLMKSLGNILLFLREKEEKSIKNIVHNFKKEANIEIDLTENNFLYRIKIKADFSKEAEERILVAYHMIELNSRSSYENSKKYLDKADYRFHDYLISLNEIDLSSGWMIMLPATENLFDKIKIPHFSKDNKEDAKLYKDILFRVLNTLDPSIISVTGSQDTDDALVIEHEVVGKIIIQNGMSLKELDRLSSGTKYGFNIADLIYAIKNQRNGIYLVDEQFSYVNTDIEKAFISLLSSLIESDEQLFVTTHNPEILDLGLPFHSYYFMKKEQYGARREVVCHCASEVENRNNVSPKTILENDYFAMTPNVEQILDLGGKDG